jgi:D-alanyl-D-alanine carboxypeptidase
VILRRTPLAYLVCLLLAGSAGLAPVTGWAQNGHPPALSAESVLLLDPEGRILFAKNPDAEHAPASLVKLMTLYLAFEDMEAGLVQWEEPVVVSLRAARTPRYRMGLRGGEQVSFGLLLEGVAIASANDAATAVAEHLAGNEEAFVARMNDKAQVLNLVHTRFANPHGLPDPNQRSTAKDLALLTSHLLQDYPQARTILGGKTFVYRGQVYHRQISLFRDPGGVQALKTGFTREAGYNLALAAWRSGQRFLCILLGSETRSLSFVDAQKLLQYGFSQTGLEPAAADRRPLPQKNSRPRVFLPQPGS